MTSPRPDASGSPAVSVVVACYLRPDGLEQLLAALEEQTFTGFEVVIVDQTAEPALERLAKEANLDVHYVIALPPPDRTGAGRRRGRRPPSNASHARNTGALRSRSDVLLFTDDDCVPQPNWVEGMSAPLREDSRAVAVTGANRVVPAAQTSPAPQRFSGRRRPHLFEGQGGSSNLAVRRQDFLTVGGFDVSIGPGTPVFGAEDQHLIWRLLIHAEESGRYVVGRQDAAVVDRPVSGRLAGLRQRWIYMGSFARMMRREHVRNRDEVAAEIMADMIRRTTPASISRALASGPPFLFLQGVVTELALVWGWWRGKHLQAFVPELGADSSRSPE